MGITIAAVLTAALLLPGIIGFSLFYSSVSTAEVKVTPPPLGTVTSLAVIGALSIIAHALWSGLLALNPLVPAVLPWPAWDPYRLIFLPSGSTATPADVWAAMAGLLATCGIGGLAGWLAARGNIRWRGEFLFGWLYPIIEKAAPTENYINAYVVTKIEHGTDMLGYEGTVENLVLNEQRQIVGLTLINVSSFYLRMTSERVRRVNAHSNLRHLVLRDTDYHNVALVVIRDETRLARR